VTLQVQEQCRQDAGLSCSTVQHAQQAVEPSVPSPNRGWNQWRNQTGQTQFH